MKPCRYIDPLDYSRFYDSRKTIIIGFSEPETRRNNNESFRTMGLDVLDIYRNQTLLLPQFFKLPCFIRLIDYATYLRLEDGFQWYIKTAESSNLIPTVVYPGYERVSLLDNQAIINPANIHPTLLQGLMSHIRNVGRLE